MRELIRLAAQLGLEVHASHLPEDVRGYYSPSEGRIYFDIALTPTERVSTLAHELGHFHHEHDCSTVENERQADIYAAKLLIHPDAYAAVARNARTREEIAEYLQVTEDIVETFETHCLSRIGDHVYTSRRIMGSAWKYDA